MLNVTRSYNIRRFKRQSRLACALGAALWVHSTTASAWGEGVCSGFEILPSEPAGLARVVAGTPRTWFIKNAGQGQDCPSPAAACRGKAYLVAGDVVVRTHSHIVLDCATYLAQDGRLTTGWLLTSALERLPTPVMLRQAWVGTWEHDSQNNSATLTLKASPNGMLEISGVSTWGGDDPERVKSGGVNIGEIGATQFSLDQPVVTLVEGVGNAPPTLKSADRCVLSLQRIEKLLLVRDVNSQCGGMNVNFSGVYQRY